MYKSTHSHVYILPHTLIHTCTVYIPMITNLALIIKTIYTYTNNTLKDKLNQNYG